MEYSPRYARFRELLRTIREEAGLTQAALANKLGKPQSFVSKSEIGERLIDFIETVDYCTACNVSVMKFNARLQENAASAKTVTKKKRQSARAAAKRMTN